MMIEKMASEAQAIRIYQDGAIREYGRESTQYGQILRGWEAMTSGANEMPAFGVSIDEWTQKQRQEGLWAEFLFDEEYTVSEMPFERLLICCKEEYSGFNIERYYEGGYRGRCYYLDLRENTMQGFCECLKRVWKE